MLSNFLSEMREPSSPKLVHSPSDFGELARPKSVQKFATSSANFRWPKAKLKETDGSVWRFSPEWSEQWNTS
jgi:hypothetical protein